MAKPNLEYVCRDCGALHPKWVGKCDSCNSWNSIIEKAFKDSAPKGLGSKPGQPIDFFGMEGNTAVPLRRVSGISEFDRVTGGGLVPGSAILIGGNPGIGKSTILMQAMAALSRNNSCIYISGEEAIDQMRLSAARLDLSKTNISLASSANVRNIITSLDTMDPPDIVVVDSIQTMYLDNLDSAPGTISQVRTSAQELVRLAKTRGFSIILVGHVTKEGTIAGPRVVEHLVDTVLYFEGEADQQFRILRAIKNRFGPTDEIGVFEMTEKGLSEITNPSEIFLTKHKKDVFGISVFASMEGKRPLLIEIQALVTPTNFASPRRAVVGWDSNRLAMVMAVLNTHCKLELGNNDVYLNIAGGLRISEPAADLAVAAALISSQKQIAVPPGTVIMGEVSLSGEIRGIIRESLRLKEAAKLGFSQAIIPKLQKDPPKRLIEPDIKTFELTYLKQLFQFFSGTKKQ